jgi:PKD repeat protein
MTAPNGTQAAPTIFNTLRPTLQWNQNDPDPGTTFTHFQLQITNEANDTMILDTGQYYEGTASTTGSWTVNQDLPPRQKLRVRVRVYDGYVWSNWSEQTWMYINRPPVADFDWLPKPVWEGDTVTLINQSTDPDGDALTYSWKVVQPDGSWSTFSTEGFSRLFILAGNYEVTLTVSDGIASDSITKTITAAPLTIHSEVTYTEKWLELHDKAGHNTTQIPKDFYSGEIMVVNTRSSPAPVAEAKAWLDTTGLDGNTLFVSAVLLSSTDPTLFDGELFDPILQSMTEGLPIGLQTVHFQIRYRNGVIKTEDIPVHIIGNVNKSVGVHRVQ